MKKIFNKLLSIFLVLSVLCSGLSFNTVAASSKIKISKTSITIKENKSYKLKITGTDEKVKWSSKNKSIATVSQKGKVTGKKAGNTTITAKVSSKTLKCKVTVKKVFSTSSDSTNSTTSTTYVYYVPGSSYAYHCTKECRTLSRSKYIDKTTLEKAKEMGLSACKVCH